MARNRESPEEAQAPALEQKAEQADGSAKNDAAPPAAPAPAEAAPKRFVVAPGKTLYGPRGPLGAGEEVHESDFTGEKQLEAHVAAGYVVEV